MDALPNRPNPLPRRRTPYLRGGRVSIPGATYFVTAVTKGRVSVLNDPVVANRLLETLGKMETAGDLGLIAATAMPDHVHLLFELRERLSVGRVCAKFKTLARDRGRSSWEWQTEQFEHRLRPHESIESYGLYIYLNPYRAALLDQDRVWPWWRCPKPERFCFTQLFRVGGLPQPEWFGQIENLVRGMHIGE